MVAGRCPASQPRMRWVGVFVRARARVRVRLTLRDCVRLCVGGWLGGWVGADCVCVQAWDMLNGWGKSAVSFASRATETVKATTSDLSSSVSATVLNPLNVHSVCVCVCVCVCAYPAYPACPACLPVRPSVRLAGWLPGCFCVKYALPGAG